MISIDPPHLKVKLNNDTVRYYVEQDYNFINNYQGNALICIGRLSMNDNQLMKNPLQVKQFIGKVKLNQFLEAFPIGQKKFVSGKEHELVSIDFHIHENEFDKRVNTSKFVAELYFNVIGDKNDYRYI
jgi:thiaminase